MEFCEAVKPNNTETLALIGYLIVANNQIHSYQVDVLNDYVTSKKLTAEVSVINDIISGTDTAVTYNGSLKAFSEENAEFQAEFIFVMYVIAYVDNLFDSKEKKILQDTISKTSLAAEMINQIIDKAKAEAEQIRENKNVVFSRILPEKKESILKRLFNWILQKIKKILRIKVAGSEDANNNEYIHAIERCAKIAKEDFAIVKPAYEEVLDTCSRTINEIQNYKNQISRDNVYAEEVVEAIGVFTEQLRKDALEQTKTARHSLAQKERTVSDFTISLLGRTKAGKSTLHAILTNQGKDRIGTGKQRTTRYNYVYQWNLLRIIDTPGIGSAEANGRSDDEIAESVLGESDVICFVVVDDSILKDILEFIEKIARLNKPIIVLLNHKENIKPEVKFKRFISDPKEWLNTQGEANLQGHVNRIMKYANEKGFGSLISVHPVFLLPATMATDPMYREYNTCLWDSSNIGLFIEKLKTWITKGGIIKRSQTILDEVSKSFAETNINILKAETLLTDQLVKIDKQRDQKLEKLKNEKREVIGRIGKLLEERYKDLATTDALAFAEEEYENMGDISKDWAAYIKKINFEKEMADEIGKELNEYRDLVIEVVSDLFENYYFSVKSSFHAQSIKLPVNIDYRGITRIGGAVCGTIGSILLVVLGLSNPVGWFVTGMGFGIGLLSNVFKSKEKKRQEAIDKIYCAIHNSVMNSMKTEIEKIIKEIDDGMQESIQGVDDLFKGLSAGLSNTIELSRQLRNKYKDQEEWLNKVYGYRLLQFITGRYEPLDRELIENIVTKVNRSVKGEITITMTQKIPEKAFEFDGIIAEQVRFI